ncbi:MAG: hypothetical protein K2X87_04250 [Gemmataceae bacterium]|nr:hypothetical protein [Gemmataceae bacterium]
MNPRRTVAPVLVLAALGPAAVAADPPDPAGLFPASTLAYAELHDPAAVAPELAGLVRGSVLEDGLAFVHKRRDAATDPRDLAKDELGLLGLLGTPELAAELPKLRIAAGLTGFTDRGEPRGAVAVLTGDSPAAGLVALAFLTSPGLRKVGVAGDVPVYQYRTPMMTYDQVENRQKIDNSKPPAEGAHEPTFAYLPGLFVAGTDRPTVGLVVERFRGQGAALAGTDGFREAAKAHRRAGVFFYADAPRFCAAFDQAVKAAGRGVEPDALGWFKLVADVRAVRYVAGVARVRDGGLSLTAAAAFDPAKPSPLLGFLAGPGVDPGLLRLAPAPAGFALAVALPEKDRAALVMGLLDALSQAAGGLGPLPSERAKELDAKYKTSTAETLTGRVRAVTVVMPAKQELPKGAVPLPTLVLHTDGPEAAAAWEEFLPRLTGDLAKTDPPQPSAETVDGIRVLSLPGTGLPWKAAVHYARKDGVVAVGLDRAIVAAAVVGGGPADGTMKAEAGVVGVGAVSPGVVLRALAAVGPDGPVVTASPTGPGRMARRRFQPVPAPAADPKQAETEAKAWDAVVAAADALPPATLTVRRAGNEVRVELWQPKAQGGLGPAVNAAVDWYDLWLNRSVDPNGNRVYPAFMR